MKAIRGAGWVVAGGLALVLAGCSGEVGGMSPRATTYGSRSAGGELDRPAAVGQQVGVRALERDYHGWPAYELSNGTVTVIVVPAIGSRVMEYNVGTERLLWANEEELGRTYAAARNEQERVWHNFGGYKVWPAPQRDWGGPPDPLGSSLDGGRWTGRITSAGSDGPAVRLVSPADRQVTGLQITRDLTLSAEGTEVRVTETFTNLSRRKITWSIWDVTQLPGLVDAGGGPTGKARVCVPLNPDTRIRGGYWTSPGQTETEQYRTTDDGRLLEVTYLKQAGKVFADSRAGWVAYTDDERGLTYVKRFGVDPTAQYPDDGATVEVYTSAGLPYLEMEVVSPLRELAPGESFSFAESWYVTRLKGPIVAATEVAAIRQRPCLQPTETGLHLTGEVGVFVTGQVRIALLDTAGMPVGEPATVPAAPTEPAVLDQSIHEVPDAQALEIALVAGDGRLLGRIATLELPKTAGGTQGEAGGCNCGKSED